MKIIPGLLPRKSTDRRFLKANLAAASYVTPATIDLRSQLLESSNQGNTSQCVAYALAGWIEFHNWKHLGVTEQIYPEPIYRLAKELDGMPDVEGTTLEAGLQAAQQLGLIAEVDTASIRDVSGPGDVKQALHRYGALLAAFQITDQWGFARAGGWIPAGGRNIGGHAVLLCGYDQVDASPWYALQNSWGDTQGWRGFNRITPEQFEQQFSYALVWGKP